MAKEDKVNTTELAQRARSPKLKQLVKTHSSSPRILEKGQKCIIARTLKSWKRSLRLMCLTKTCKNSTLSPEKKQASNIQQCWVALPPALLILQMAGAVTMTRGMTIVP